MEKAMTSQPVSERLSNEQIAHLRDMTTRCHGSSAARDARMKRGIPWGALDRALAELQRLRQQASEGAWVEWHYSDQMPPHGTYFTYEIRNEPGSYATCQGWRHTADKALWRHVVAYFSIKIPDYTPPSRKEQASDPEPT